MAKTEKQDAVTEAAENHQLPACLRQLGTLEEVHRQNEDIAFKLHNMETENAYHYREVKRLRQVVSVKEQRIR